MSSEITLYEKLTDPMDAMQRMGEMFAKSGMAGCEKAEQGQMLALACLAERKSPFDILRKYHLIGGRLSMRADAMLAEYRGHGGKVAWKQADAKAAIGVWTFDGSSIEIGFTESDAKLAGCLPAKPGSGWAKFPDAMLRARCISKAVRMLCPEAVAGVHLPDEIGETEQPRPVVVSDPLLTAKPVQAEPEPMPPEPSGDRRCGKPEQPPAQPPTQPYLADHEKRGPGRPKKEDAKVEPPAPPAAVEGGPMAAPVAPSEPKPEPAASTPPAPKPEPDIYAELAAFIAPFKADALQWFKAKQWLAGDTEDIGRIGEDKVTAVLARKQHFTQAVKTYIAQLKEGA